MQPAGEQQQLALTLALTLLLAWAWAACVPLGLKARLPAVAREQKLYRRYTVNTLQHMGDGEEDEQSNNSH